MTFSNGTSIGRYDEFKIDSPAKNHFDWDYPLKGNQKNISKTCFSFSWFCWCIFLLMVGVPHTQFPPPQVISLAHKAKQGPNVATFVVQQIGFTQGLFESQLKLRVMENNNTGFKNRYLDLPRSAEWVVRGAYTPFVRVPTTSILVGL